MCVGLRMHPPALLLGCRGPLAGSTPTCKPSNTNSIPCKHKYTPAMASQSECCQQAIALQAHMAQCKPAHVQDPLLPQCALCMQ